MKQMNKKNYKQMLVIFIVVIIVIIAYFKILPYQQSLALDKFNNNDVKISKAKMIDIEKIINANIKSNKNTEEIYEKYEELEYITKYRYNDELYIGTTQVYQEGRNGIQTITMKKNIDNAGNILGEEQISAIVTKSSIDKIIDIGTKKYVAPKKTSPVTYENTNNGESDNNSTGIIPSLSFDMELTIPSGFSIEQFKSMLTDSKDKNKIFEENSDYFYYIENQYNINGVFVAAVGIHESAWGTSKIAKDKFNLFGYGAYDSNPYNGAYTFSSYSESIDLLARVLVKYYLNKPGTIIYDGQKASGKYYNGNTLSAVNQNYATDKSWCNGVYYHMQYLYNKNK